MILSSLNSLMNIRESNNVKNKFTLLIRYQEYYA